MTIKNKEREQCPLTRLKIRKDTILDNFPLFCPKCKSEMLICVKQFHISIIKEPDAQTQSR
ncbi:MAG: conjugal transfer protein [Clostridium sp.]|nr:conjugal transfer protein [Clostridium sp.]